MVETAEVETAEVETAEVGRSGSCRVARTEVEAPALSIEAAVVDKRKLKLRLLNNGFEYSLCAISWPFPAKYPHPARIILQYRLILW